MKFESLILKYSHLQGIEPIWPLAIIQRESLGNPLALRYEPNYPYLYKPEFFSKGSSLISADTEVATQKMSWGLGQVMGALAREQGLTGLMGQLFDPEVNIHHVCKRLAYLKGLSPVKDDIFAMYNGGPAARLKNEHGVYRNQAYVNAVNQYISIFVN